MISRYRAKLSDREYKRYEYLMQNLHYLNDKEKQELAFLHAKAEGRIQEPQVATPVSQSTEPQVTQPTRQKPSAKKSSTSSKRHKKGGMKRFFTCLVVMVLGLVLLMAVMFFKGLFGVTSGNQNLKPAMTEYFQGQATRDGINILILGSDKRITEESTDARTDTIMVMNVGNSSGKIKLVSFMRDTLVNIDGYSAPDTYDTKLNTAFTLGELENNQGAEFVRQTLKHNFDIDVQYYAMIDFETFAIAVDTLFPNGVQMDAKFSTINGETVASVEVPDDVGFGSSGELYQTIAVGPQRMNGKTLLNYARYRSDDEGDNGRTRRQQEVMQAVLSQIKDPATLFTGSEAIGKIYALTSTNISFPFVLQNGLSGLTASQKGIERMTIPEQGDWLDEYDKYGGLGLLIDFEAYKERLAQLGLR